MRRSWFESRDGLPRPHVGPHLDLREVLVEGGAVDREETRRLRQRLERRVGVAREQRLR